MLNTSGANTDGRVVVTDNDVTNFLSVTRPGLMSLSTEFFLDCKNHLQAEVDAGRLTQEGLRDLADARAKMPKIEFD